MKYVQMQQLRNHIDVNDVKDVNDVILVTSWRHFGVFIVNSDYISHLFVVFLLSIASSGLEPPLFWGNPPFSEGTPLFLGTPFFLKQIKNLHSSFWEPSKSVQVNCIKHFKMKVLRFVLYKSIGNIIIITLYTFRLSSVFTTDIGFG